MDAVKQIPKCAVKIYVSVRFGAPDYPAAPAHGFWIDFRSVDQSLQTAIAELAREKNREPASMLALDLSQAIERLHKCRQRFQDMEFHDLENAERHEAGSEGRL